MSATVDGSIAAGLRACRWAIALLSAQFIMGAYQDAAAEEVSIGRCRTPPRLVSAEQVASPLMTELRDATVTIELTVRSDGSIDAVAIVASSDTRLNDWAKQQALRMRFAPVSKPCRIRVPIQYRLGDNDEGA